MSFFFSFFNIETDLSANCSKTTWLNQQKLINMKRCQFLFKAMFNCFLINFNVAQNPFLSDNIVVPTIPLYVIMNHYIGFTVSASRTFTTFCQRNHFQKYWCIVTLASKDQKTAYKFSICWPKNSTFEVCLWSFYQPTASFLPVFRLAIPKPGLRPSPGCQVKVMEHYFARTLACFARCLIYCIEAFRSKPHKWYILVKARPEVLSDSSTNTVYHSNWDSNIGDFASWNVPFPVKINHLQTNRPLATFG